MPLPSDRIYATEVPATFRRQYGASVNYQALWRLIVSGEVEAEKVGNRWTVPKAALPTIAATLGLTRAPVPA